MSLMTDGEPNATSDRRTVVAVFLAGVAVFLVLYETQGLIPAIREAYSIDAPTASLTVSATNVAMACFLIPFSLLASRIGHARQIAAGVIVAAVLALILPFMPSAELLIAVRFLQGIAIASVPATAMAYLSLRLSPSALPGAIGVYIAGNTIGGLSSRLLTGLAAEVLGWHGGLAFTAAVSLALGLIVVWLLRRDLTTTAPKRRVAHEGQPRRSPIPLSHGLWAIYLTGFLCMIVFGGSFTMLGSRLQRDPWQLSEGAVALFFLIYLVGTVVTTYYGRLALRFTRTRLTLIGMVVAIIGAVLTLVNSLPVIVIGMSLLTGGFFLGHTGASAAASAARPGVDTTRSAAIYLTVYYLGTSLGAWLSAVLFTDYAWPGVVVMCVTSLAAVVVLVGFTQRHRSSPS
ncbi:MFS transporter [Brevibacterium metallidurans]|uniref:MFS transporter n=2 Tax=Brevibacterium metallidurans TaxID=1482676 RepID=A0ABP3C3V3_9MICO